MKPSADALSTKTRLSLGLGFFSLFFIDKGAELLAIPFYQMTLGVDPFLFSLALTIPIVISAFLSPWVGKLSDNCQSRFGRRRPFVFIAAWMSCLSFGVIWMVPQHWSEQSQLIYFFASSLLFNLTSIFYTVPLTSMSYEVTNDSSQRIKVMEVNSYFIKVASLLSQWAYPLATIAIFGSVYVGVKVVGWGIAIVIIGLIGMLPAFLLQEKKVEPQQVPHDASLVESIRVIIKIPLMRLVLALVFIQLGLAAYAAKMDYYLIVYYMNDGDIGQGATWKAVLSMGYALMAAIYIPIVSWLSRRFGKIQALIIIYGLVFLGGIGKWFIFTPGVQWLLLIDPILCSAIWTAMTIIIPSMIAQASNQDTEHSTLRREGVFAALHGWIVAVSAMIALVVSGLSLNLIGFDATQGSEQLTKTLQSMRYILSAGTVLSSLLAIALLRHYQKHFQESNTK